VCNMPLLRAGERRPRWEHQYSNKVQTPGAEEGTSGRGKQGDSARYVKGKLEGIIYENENLSKEEKRGKGKLYVIRQVRYKTR